MDMTIQKNRLKAARVFNIDMKILDIKTHCIKMHEE